MTSFVSYEAAGASLGLTFTARGRHDLELSPDGKSTALRLVDPPLVTDDTRVEMAEVWKAGFALPAQNKGGGAHSRLLEELLEYPRSPFSVSKYVDLLTY